MKKGRYSPSNVNQQTASIIHVAGFLVPVILSLYGLLILFSIYDPLRNINPAVFAAVSFAWVALGTYQLVRPSKSRNESACRLIFYHVLTMAFVLLVSGFSMPFIHVWVVLFLASYQFFSHDGLRLSAVALFVTGITDTVINLGDQQYLLTNALSLISTLIVGMVAVAISQVQQVDRRELAEARTKGLVERDRVITLVNNLADAVLSTDRSGVVQIYNAAALNLLDTNAELVGTSIDKVLPLFNADNHMSFKLTKMFKAAKSVISRDDLQLTVSGETIRLSVILSPIHSTDSSTPHTIDGYIVILRDITKQKSLEEERDEFISVVSHELRTPITIAEGTLGNVEFMMGRDDIPKATLQSNIKTAHSQVLFLAKMVNDLSTLSRAERGVADEPELINTNELVHTLFNEYAPQAEEKGLRFNLDLSPKLGNIMASRLYLKELLQNFITNAIKYTKEGEVTLMAIQEGDSVVFSVKDTGIGISKSDQEHIFEKFWRSEDYRTRETGGTGLGLYVTRKLASKLDTSIRMTSRLNHGSTFSFELPTHTDDAI